MPTCSHVIKQLESLANPKNVEGMGRFGMSTKNRLGISMPDLRRIGKQCGTDHSLALKLWKTGIPEARIVAAIVADPEKLTEHQMESWVKDVDSWDVCDQLCMNLLENSPLAWKKVREWSLRKEEFVKRTAYSLIACMAWHLKDEKDSKFTSLFPVIKHGVKDERNYVKKSVSWALRTIGKRNLNLNQKAIALAGEILMLNTKSSRWAAKDCLRELQSPKIQQRLR